MTIDKRPDTKRPLKPSSNEVEGGPGGRIPTPGNPSKQPPHLDSQKPAPRSPYGH